MKRIALAALVALLAGCAGHGSSAPPAGPISVHGGVRVPQSNGGPGTASLTYDDTWAPTGQCSPGVLTVNNTYAPAHNLSFAAGQGPPLVLSNCNFSTPQYVQVTLEKPKYGDPFIRQTDYTVTIDAPGPAKVTATWTACGPTLPCDPGLKGDVTFTIGPPSPGPL